MPKQVIKNNGKKEPFIKEKIVVSTIKTGAPAEIAREIADDVEKHPGEEIETRQIRRLVLEKLKTHNPDWPKRWLSYDKAVKRLYKYRF